MNPLIELNLTVLLFLPWLAVLGGLFWYYPRTPRDAARRRFDALSLILSLGAFVLSVHWAYGSADVRHGHLWPQIFATAVSYGVFLAVLGSAFALRRRWLLRRTGRVVVA